MLVPALDSNFVQPHALMNTSAATRLAGLELDGGWRVLHLLEPSPTSTGGNFSSGYEVESARGKRAFLKALDYSRAMQSPDPAMALNAMTGRVYLRA